MKRIIITTMFADLAGSVANGLIISFLGNVDALLFIMVMTFINVFIPTLLAVIIYQFIKSIYYINLKRTIALHSLLMIAIAIAALLFWNLIDILTGVGLKGTSISAFKNNFKDQFQGYLAAAIIVSGFIPLIQIFLTQKLFPQKN